MKRTKILLAAAIAVVSVAGATAAWAQTTSNDRGAKRQALRDCVAQARAAHPDAPKADLKDDVKACLEAKGITLPQPLTDEQKAQAKACIQQARADHPGDRPAIREQVKSCLQQHGIELPLRHRPRP